LVLQQDKKEYFREDEEEVSRCEKGRQFEALAFSPMAGRNCHVLGCEYESCGGNISK